MRSFLETFLKAFGFVDRLFKRAVQCVLAVTLLTMVGMVFLQVVMRDVFHSGISWADVASRHMVIWIAFLGAMLATRSRQHIGIDLVTRIIPRKGRNILRFVLDIVSCIVCVFLANAAITLVGAEREMGTVILLSLPLWTVQLIIPLGFILMACEYAFGVALDILRYFYDGVVYRLASERRPL